MLRIIVIYISSLYIHPCVNLTVYLSQSTLIGSRLSDAKRGWLNNTHGSVQSHLSPSEPVRRLLLVFWKNWGGGTCLLCPSSYTPVCKALCVCEAKQGWVQTAVRNYGKPNSAYCSSTNSHFVFEKLCSYSVHCEFTLFNIIFGIIGISLPNEVYFCNIYSKYWNIYLKNTNYQSIKIPFPAKF